MRLLCIPLGFKSFWAARCTIVGMEVMHVIRKGQLMTLKATTSLVFI